MQNYQRKAKKVAILLTLIMLFNFLFNPVMTIVNAANENDALEKITEITTKLNNIDQKIEETKQGVGYESDIALVKSIAKIEEEVEKLKLDFNSDEESLNTSISVATLITNSNNVDLNNKLTEYLNLNNTLPTYDITTIDDIKYDKEGVEQTLITKDELAQLIISEYLNDDDSLISNYLTNFDTNVNNYINEYNTFIQEIEDAITLVDNEKTNIEAFILNEKTLGNIPDETVDNENIISLLDNIKNELGTLKTNIDLTILTEQTNKLDELKDKLSNYKTKFEENNNDYLSLGLDTEIGVLETNYNSVNSNIETWFSINNLEIDYALVNDKLDNDLIDFLKEALELDETYKTLNEKVNKYLSRKPSDNESLTNLMANLNSLYEKLSKENILNNIDKIVNNTDLTVEVNVDKLYSFLCIEDLSEETRKIIENAKLNFYELSLLDETNYTWEVLEDEIIIKGLKDKLLYIDLTNNISYTGIYTIEDLSTNNYVSGSGSINLYDNNNNFIKTYKFITQGDIDNNGLFEENDLTELKKLILKKDSNEKEVLLSDLNNDNKVTIKDLIILQDIINTNQTPSETEYATESNIKLIRTEDNNKVYYDILLEADGVVQGLEFNIGTTNDLTFVGFETDYNILLDNSEKPTLVIGTDEFKSGQIVRLTYEKNETEVEQTTFIISNIVLVNTITSVNEVERLINTIVNIKPVQEEQEPNVVQTINNVIENVEETVSKEEEPKLEITDVEEIEEEQIAWGNVIKIAIIVLLGALIIYFLNKKEEEPIKEQQNKKDETK